MRCGMCTISSTLWRHTRHQSSQQQPKLLPTGSSSIGEGHKLLLPWGPGVHQHQKLSCTHVPFRLHMCRGMDCVRAHHTTGSMQLHPPHSKPVASASPMRATAHQWVQVKGHRQCCDHVPAQPLHIDPADFGPLRTSHLHTYTHKQHVVM